MSTTVPPPHRYLVAIISYFSPPDEPPIADRPTAYRRLLQLALHTLLFIVSAISPELSLPKHPYGYLKYAGLSLTVFMQHPMDEMMTYNFMIFLALFPSS